MKRKEEREWILKYIYSHMFHDELEGYELEKFILNFDEKVNDSKYIQTSVNGIIDNLDDIDKYISKYLNNWTNDRIPKVDLAILRSAIFEIMYVDEIPVSITINEAVELSKKFSTKESFKFINGLLGVFVRENGFTNNEAN